jgi:hypothetical protein
MAMGARMRGRERLEFVERLLRALESGLRPGRTGWNPGISGLRRTDSPGHLASGLLCATPRTVKKTIGRFVEAGSSPRATRDGQGRAPRRRYPANIASSEQA